MTAKKTTTTKTTVEKEIKTPATEVKATTSTKATTSAKTTKAKASTKKMTKDELVKKAMESNAKEEVKKPVEKKPAEKTVKKAAMTKKVQTKAKTPVFPEILKIDDLGTLKKVTSENYEEFKNMENIVFVTVWNKKSVKYYDDSHTPGVRTSDLFTLGNWSYDVSTPVYWKNSEQVVTISNFTEACFIFGHANCFDILEDENGEGTFRNDYDLVFEIYQLVEEE